MTPRMSFHVFCCVIVALGNMQPSQQMCWTARVGIHYRAIAKERAEGLNWFWIGHHSEYDKLLS